jgi:hypothetical protein
MAATVNAPALGPPTYVGGYEVPVEQASHPVILSILVLADTIMVHHGVNSRAFAVALGFDRKLQIGRKWGGHAKR